MKTSKFIILALFAWAILLPAQAQEKSYYSNGEVLTLHKHSKGKGVDVVFIGDGYSHEDLNKGGLYETNCQKLKDLFLVMPVVKYMQEYFNVYAYVAESEESGVTRGTKNCFGSGERIKFNKVRQTVNSIPGISKERFIIFIGNGMVGGYAMGDIAVFSNNEGRKPYWMVHEFVGHIIGRMPDLYCDGSTATTLSDEVKKGLDNYHAEGLGWMVDYNSDPKTVLWKDFIGRKGYEQVGVYPANYYGACGLVWAPEPKSCMWQNIYCFSAPERYQLWRQINRISGKSYDLKSFFKWDKKYYAGKTEDCTAKVYEPYDF
jgi:hypothetical protein